jgi:hypothetical protein
MKLHSASSQGRAAVGELKLVVGVDEELRTFCAFTSVEIKRLTV